MYASFFAKFSIGDTVYFYDDEAECLKRFIVERIKVVGTLGNDRQVVWGISYVLKKPKSGQEIELLEEFLTGRSEFPDTADF